MNFQLNQSGIKIMSTLQQIEALQKQLAEEITCAEFLQSDPLLAEVLSIHKNRIHPMFNRPLYGCVAWVSFDVTPDFIANVLPELFNKHITTLSGSGFWRYTSVPNLPENCYYTKNGRNGKKYIGVNGAPSSDNCTGIYSFGPLSALLPELAQC